MNADNLCIGCGVCCRSYRVAFHWSETTAFAGGAVPVDLTEPLRLHEVAMRGTSRREPHCIALIGSGPDDPIGARCSIHGRHPSVCRQVQIGDDQCVRARRRFGLPDPTASQRAGGSASMPDIGP